MSSSVSAVLIVQRNLERERRLLSDRRAELSRLADKGRLLCKEARGARQRFGQDFPDLLPRDPILDSAQDTLAETDGSIAQLRDWLLIESQRLETALAVHEVQRIMANVANSTRGEAALSARERQGHANEVLAQLSPGVPVREVQALAEAAAVVVASAGDAAFAVGLLDLKFKAQRLNERCVQERASSRRAQKLLDDLHGFSDWRLDGLCDELRRVVAQEIPMRRSLSDEVAAQVATARDLADCRYAAIVLEEELSQLGYSVGPDFQTVLVRGGKLQLTHPEMQEYQVEIEATGGQQPFRSVLTREDTGMGRGREQLDTRMQQTWCEHLAVAFGRAKDRGVFAQVNHHVKAGENPVQVSTGVKLGQTQKDRVFPTRKRPADLVLRPNVSKE